MGVLLTILYFILMLILVLGGIFVLKMFVFNKVSINKFIPLALAIIAIVVEIIIRADNLLINTVIMLLAVYLFAWFLDIHTCGKVKIEPEKKIVIKSKAKPNRAKYRDNNKK